MFLENSGQNTLTYFLTCSFHSVKIKLAGVKIGRQEQICLSFCPLSKEVTT